MGVTSAGVTSDASVAQVARGAVQAAAAVADELWQRLPSQEDVLDATGGWLRWPYVLVPVAVGAVVWWSTPSSVGGNGVGNGKTGVKGGHRGRRGEWDDSYSVYG